MKINKEDFDVWAISALADEEKYSASRVAKIAGISKSSFFFQRSKDYVEASAIIALARALRLKPLDELLKFAEFKTFSEHQEPSELEVLSQVGPQFFMEELLARLHHEEADHTLEAMPDASGLKRWLDAVGMYGKYEEVAQKLDLANIRVLSKKINENRMTFGQLASLCEYGNLNGRMGLVVTGNLTWEEAGFRPDIREKILRSASGATIVDALWSSRKWLEKEIQVKELERGVYESFG